MILIRDEMHRRHGGLSKQTLVIMTAVIGSVVLLALLVAGFYLKKLSSRK